MAIQVIDSPDYKHVKWVELTPGVMTECAIMKTDEQNNMYFFELASLDDVDKRRVFKLLTNRHAGQHELWDLMSQHTLGNGMNALNYFHQLVKIITPDGRVINPRAGQIGRATTQVAPKPAAE